MKIERCKCFEQLYPSMIFLQTVTLNQQFEIRFAVNLNRRLARHLWRKRHSLFLPVANSSTVSLVSAKHVDLSSTLELFCPVPGYNGTFCWALSLVGWLVLVSGRGMKVLSCRAKLQSSLGMTVNGMTGLLDSRSRAVRKHSMAASFFPWACKTSPRLFQALWLVVWIRMASLRTFWARSLRSSLLSTRPCQQTSDKQLIMAKKTEEEMEPPKVLASWADVWLQVQESYGVGDLHLFLENRSNQLLNFPFFDCDV